MTDEPAGKIGEGFQSFLVSGVERGGFETDDLLYAMLPLMEQVLEMHEQGLVAPLAGLAALQVTHRQLWFENAAGKEPGKATGEIQRIQRALASRAMTVVGQNDLTVDLDQSTEWGGGVSTDNRRVVDGETTPNFPVYVAGYLSWEQRVGHHDALTDIFSLGMLMASLACGLDFDSEEELERFVEHRDQLAVVNPELHPVVATAIVRMTEIDRHVRAPDLRSLFLVLKNYRDQPLDEEFDFGSMVGFESASPQERKHLIHQNLRSRLFEISRRNRLIYFRQTLSTLNLTVSSVPLLLDYKTIRPEQLLIWQPSLAKQLTQDGEIALGRYLRFEDAPYLSGVLDTIRRDANRDKREYGFAQLRLVLTFLRWHNLKENKEERIHSPLLLFPVELQKKKGVRDSYTLVASGTEAEVNPVLRHHLKQLYDLDLPERVDLSETSVDAVYEVLLAQIKASEPAVELKKIDRPQIDLMYEKACKRLDVFRQRRRTSGRTRTFGSINYSYKAENFEPLGLQLYLRHVRPGPLPLEYLFTDKPDVRRPEVQGIKQLSVTRETYALREGSKANPYVWDFDLCSLTLGNFNYRKMSLVQDYNELVVSEGENSAFEDLFALDSKKHEAKAPPPLPLDEQYLIVPSDPTQASAIAWGREGQNMIIQGPPGTGKSQTITNLIADYVANGKHVLFVCEKRAALDVVYHRLAQSGLDRLACLIHDSQTDKKSFVMDLKESYEGFLSAKPAKGLEKKAKAQMEIMLRELETLQLFSDGMLGQPDGGDASVRDLIGRLVELKSHVEIQDAEAEEAVPAYRDWEDFGSRVKRLVSTLIDLGVDPVFARHPLRYLQRECFRAESPVTELRRRLEDTDAVLERVSEGVDSLPLDVTTASLADLKALCARAGQAHFLAKHRLLSLLDSESPEAKQHEDVKRQITAQGKKLTQAREKTTFWKNKFSHADTVTALEQAIAFEASFLSVFKPARWRLAKVLKAEYLFARHSVKPTWSAVLADLLAEHEVIAETASITERGCLAFGVETMAVLDDALDSFQGKNARVGDLSRVWSHRFNEFLLKNSAAAELVERLVEMEQDVGELVRLADRYVSGAQEKEIAALEHVQADLREGLKILPELLPDLNDLLEVPDQFYAALCNLELDVKGFEAACAAKTLHQVYREDRGLNRFAGWMLRRSVERVQEASDALMALNGPRIIERVRAEFVEHHSIAGKPAAQLDSEQKELKKDFNKGRRVLEHEFGKTMRYKSIREMAADSSGRVILQIKPIWLMSPLSISDTMPLDVEHFDVVIFDEASQIKLEEAIPAVYRAEQVIVVGDEMQLPPTNFFSAGSVDENDLVELEEDGEAVAYDLSADSFLSHAGRNLPSTLLGWHYRSRFESLIGFSNNAFYHGELLTIPDRRLPIQAREELCFRSAEEGGVRAPSVLQRSISFHYAEHGRYEKRRNRPEADYIAQLVKGLLAEETGLSIGIVAFSEAQQGEIELALNQLAAGDTDFRNRLAAEMEREEDHQFCGLFVKNLENVQGDERDIIILSICYGHDAKGKMRMNFGPINKSGGEKRLNVIFSRARRHMAVVSSIRSHDITNDYNDGANCLKNYLEYSDAISRGDESRATRILRVLSAQQNERMDDEPRVDAIVQDLSAALIARGFEVSMGVGQSHFTCDLAVRNPGASEHQVAILVDTVSHYAVDNVLERYVQRPGILRAFGWEVIEVLAKDWFHAPEDVLSLIVRVMSGEEIVEEADLTEVEQEESVEVGDDGEIEIDVLPVLEDVARDQDIETRFLEFKDERSDKFWEITRRGMELSVRFGRTGTAGQSRVRCLDDVDAAKAEMKRNAEQKLKKGYVEQETPRSS